MSERERCLAALELVPDSMLGYVIGYIQGLLARAPADQEDIPNAETVAALIEGDEMLCSGSGQHFQGSATEFFALLDAEDDADA